jgi:hypothetical protein
MVHGLPERSDTGVWSELLGATRDALAALRADDLEELARRAECMAEVSVAQASSAKCYVAFSPQLSRVVREHRLLADLLRATHSNLQVLKRLDQQAASGEVNSRWVR